jgi:hypothetical protein
LQVCADVAHELCPDHEELGYILVTSQGRSLHSNKTCSIAKAMP